MEPDFQALSLACERREDLAAPLVEERVVASLELFHEVRALGAE
jgi:hypothetical protein